MTLSLRLDSSNKFSWTPEIRSAFAVTVVPEVRRIAPLDLVVVLDVSGSMKTIDTESIDPNMLAGYTIVDGIRVALIKGDERMTRLGLARDGLRELLHSVDPNTKVTLITFASDVKVICNKVQPEVALGYLDEIKSEVTQEGNTALYLAVTKAISIVGDRPAKIILLTDGYPTDVVDESMYSDLSLPQFSQIVPIGIGDYNERIMKALAERSNGRFYHLGNLEEVKSVLEGEKPKLSGGIKVKLDLFSELPLSLINYSKPLNIGTVEGVIRVLGFVDIPPLYSGEVLRARLTYVDTVDNEKKRIEKSLVIRPAKDVEQFRNGVDQSLSLEASYYQKLKEVQKLIDQGMQVEATRRVAELSKIAEATKRMELIESTRKIAGANSIKEMSSEITRRMRPT